MSSVRPGLKSNRRILDVADPRLKAAADELSSVVQAQRGGRQFSVIIDEVYVETIEESYDGGEIGRWQMVKADSNVGTFPSVDVAIRKVAGDTGIPEGDFYATAGKGGAGAAITGTGMVDENNFYRGDDNTFLVGWKEGKERAWTMSVTIVVRFAGTWSPTLEDFRKAGLRTE